MLSLTNKFPRKKFWPLLASFGFFWLLLATFGHPLLDIFRVSINDGVQKCPNSVQKYL